MKSDDIQQLEARDAAFAKLPKWARERIENAEREVSRTRKIVAALTTPDALQSWSKGHPEVVGAIPDHAVVEFRLPNNETDRFANIQIRREIRDENVLHISGSWTLEIVPQAGNSIDIRLQQRRPTPWP